MLKYGYSALPHQHAIRLLELQPGKASEQLVGSLRSIDIDRTPAFDALSYVWGNPETTAELFLDGCPLGLTSNLADALQRIRRVDCPRLLWVDAICIDQNNLQERGEQVQLMRSIYQQAVEVLVWLGPEDGDGGSDEVFKFMDELWEECGLSSVAGLKPLRASSAVEISNSFKQHSLKAFPPADSPLWPQLLHFYRQVWFTRVWVIQEVAVSTSATIMYGRKEIKWRKLGFVSELILTKILQNDPGTESGYEEHFYNSLSNAALIWDFSSDNAVRAAKREFVHVLDAARNFGATDPRDKVYALLGLVDGPSHDPWRIIPDYTEPHHRLYRLVTKGIIFETKDLEVLSAVEHELPTFGDSPSWVPQWNKVKRTSSLGSASRVNYQASMGYSYIPRNSPDENCLIAQGVAIDTISQLTAVMNPEDFYPEERARESTSTYHPWIDSMSRTPMYRTGETSEAAYSLTLVADSTRGTTPGHDVLPQHLADFSAYLYSYFKIGMPEAYISSNLRMAAQGGNGARFALAARNMCNGRRFFITSQGYIGIGPAALRQYDLVCILFGGVTPFILKKEVSSYRLIGEAYVHGLMSGEAIVDLEDGKLSAKSFWLR